MTNHMVFLVLCVVARNQVQYIGSEKWGFTLSKTIILIPVYQLFAGNFQKGFTEENYYTIRRF